MPPVYPIRYASEAELVRRYFPQASAGAISRVAAMLHERIVANPEPQQAPLVLAIALLMIEDEASRKEVNDGSTH